MVNPKMHQERFERSEVEIVKSYIYSWCHDPGQNPHYINSLHCLDYCNSLNCPQVTTLLRVFHIICLCVVKLCFSTTFQIWGNSLQPHIQSPSQLYPSTFLSKTLYSHVSEIPEQLKYSQFPIHFYVFVPDLLYLSFLSYIFFCTDVCLYNVIYFMFS